MSMKKVLNIIAAALAFVSAVSCTIKGADAFPHTPTAPVVDAHADILVTEATKAEDVVFTWSKARYIDADVLRYDFHAVYEETDVVLASELEGLAYITTKTLFLEKLNAALPLAENSTSTISFYVTVKDREGKEYASEKVSVKIYLYGDAVPAVVEPVQDEIVLDKETPDAPVELLTWDPARLVYGEDVTYNVVASVGSTSTPVATGVEGTSFTLTVDQLNEAAVAAGATEGEQSEVAFTVVACCESIPDGIPSESVVVKITTYVATFPEVLYIPGSHQGWSPATAPTIKHSSAVKGEYEGFVDFTVEDGGDVEFKFAPVPDWVDDFSFDNIEVTTVGVDESAFSHVTGKGKTSANVKCPSGFYYIKVSLKFNTIEMVEARSLGLIGGFNSWSVDVPFTWDATAQKWTSEEVEIEKGVDFKVRFNGDWTYSFGTSLDPLVFGGGNITFDKETGKYMFTIDATSGHTVLKAIDVNMPETLTVAGNYGAAYNPGYTWTPAVQVCINLAGNGVYKGYVDLTGNDYDEGGNTSFKLVKNGSEWIGGTSNGDGTFTLGAGDNMQVPAGLYYLEADIINGTLKTVELTKVGVIGDGVGGWDADKFILTYVAANHAYEGDVDFVAGGFKFRFNEDWAYNLGGDPLVHDGSNIDSPAVTKHVSLRLQGPGAPCFTYAE